MISVEFIKRGILSKIFFEEILTDFCESYDIAVNHIIIDLRKTVDDYVTEGLFGEFKDMYKDGTLYMNPHHFIEYQLYASYDLAQIIMHDLVHCRQISTGQMVVKGNTLKFNGEKYNQVPFSVDLFNKIKDENPTLAEEYHWTALPWERDAYALPEEFMIRPLWEAYRA